MLGLRFLLGLGRGEAHFKRCVILYLYLITFFKEKATPTTLVKESVKASPKNQLFFQIRRK